MEAARDYFIRNRINVSVPARTHYFSSITATSLYRVKSRIEEEVYFPWRSVIHTIVNK